MNFSSRLPSDIRDTRLSLALAEIRADGAELLDLTESNPTRAGFQYDAAGILSALADERSLVYTADPFGLPAAREAIAELHQVNASQVLLTSSTSEAYGWLFKLLCDPGDQVLIPRPSYPLFELLAGLESVVLRPYALRYDAGWFIDFHSLLSALSPRTRAIVIVNPNNPTGNYVSAQEHAELVAICESRRLALISDEVFSDFALGGIPHSALRESRAVTFVLGGLSKLLGLPQMKLAWIISTGPSQAITAARRRLELIADTYLSVGAPVQYAVQRFLRDRRFMQAQIIARLRENLAFLDSHVAGSSASLLRADAGWQAILRLPRTRSEEEWIELLLRTHGTLVQPGYFYDFDSEAFVVLSLLTEAAVFREGVRRIVTSLER